MLIDLKAEKVRIRKWKIKSSNKSYIYGHIYLPERWVGKSAFIIEEDQYKNFAKLLSTLLSAKNFFESLLNLSSGKRMFSIVTKTWNPVTGCLHECRYCWARKLALGRLKNSKRYRDGFNPKLNLEEFRKKFDEGEVIFVSDMGDLFGDFIPDKWIHEVIDHIKHFPKTYFLLLTKNPERYFEFLDVMPPNAILGTTIETNKDELYLESNISKASLPSKRYKAMRDLDWKMKFVAIEPILDFDLEVFVKWIKEIGPFMIYVGYDNYNNKLPEPTLRKTEELLKKLSNITLVVRKTIRPSWFEGMRSYCEKGDVV